MKIIGSVLGLVAWFYAPILVGVSKAMLGLGNTLPVEGVILSWLLPAFALPAVAEMKFIASA